MQKRMFFIILLIILLLPLILFSSQCRADPEDETATAEESDVDGAPADVGEEESESIEDEEDTAGKDSPVSDEDTEETDDAEETGEADEHPPKVDAVHDGQTRTGVGEALDEGDTRSGLEEEAQPAGQAALLANPHPHQGGALHGPGGRGPLVVQPQGDGHAGEDDPQGEESLHQHAQAQAVAVPQGGGQEHVKGAHPQGAHGQPVGVTVHQGALEGEDSQGQAENQGAVDQAPEPRQLAQGVKDGDSHVKEKE